jgi:hypothetical protein
LAAFPGGKGAAIKQASREKIKKSYKNGAMMEI